VLIWAIIGIALKHATTPEVNVTSWLVVGSIALLTIIQFARTVLVGRSQSTS
jgi:hypothetical protein